MNKLDYSQRKVFWFIWNFCSFCWFLRVVQFLNNRFQYFKLNLPLSSIILHIRIPSNISKYIRTTIIKNCYVHILVFHYHYNETRLSKLYWQNLNLIWKYIWKLQDIFCKFIFTEKITYSVNSHLKYIISVKDDPTEYWNLLIVVLNIL